MRSPEEGAARIRAAIARVPRGKVATYGGIALAAGLPGRARLVGTVLRNEPAASRLPWYRIINASGRISLPPGSEACKQQRARLEAEGIRFVKGRVDLDVYGWPSRARPRDLDEALWGPDAPLNMARGERAGRR